MNKFWTCGPFKEAADKLDLMVYRAEQIRVFMEAVEEHTKIVLICHLLIKVYFYRICKSFLVHLLNLFLDSNLNCECKMHLKTF